ncbi:MerR family transcriptional regulator [Tissierella carlieri]|uniref:MerR family transcriptional regulator n=1 Tax=Tissierella carlieri TaxID=689904 RepID=A0ABT1SAY8_9FIRM|nr:MerR family transcriptional regulator [Tissierella carlieri]MBU5313959.1 MerR family transcriptional regulator [Tissierella carlieri]MCQ4923475.1 MerR family transcriptional regulator [Tissierella carlieri]
MQINEVCKQTGLTKKAIEYYQNKGLISPIIKENGYREFTDDNLEQLKMIALLRRLDIGTDDIREVIESKDKKSVLIMIKQEKQIQAKAKLARIELIEELIREEDMYKVQDRINLLEQQTTIKEKLMIAFPGYYGRYISIHFGQFLNEPIKTEEQNRMYGIIVDFLDNIESIQIPEELQPILDKANLDIEDEVLEKLNQNMQAVYDDFETYWKTNKDSIVEYAEFKKSEEYQDSMMAQQMNLFRKFGETSGYYDIFIPAMRKLSPAYDKYYEKMLEANDKLIQKIPDIEKW